MSKSPIKINTSFLFKRKKSIPLEKQKNNLSVSSTKNESTFNNYLSTNTPQSFKNDKIKKKILSDKIDYSINKSSYDKSESEALKQRESNIKERDAFLASFMKDPDFAKAIQEVGLFQKLGNAASSKRKKVRRKRNTEENFRSNCQIPLEHRKSLRLQEKDPQFSYQDLPDESTVVSSLRKKNLNSDDDIDNLEEVIYEPKVKRVRINRENEQTRFLYVEDVTEMMLKNISKKVSEKVYCSNSGTSCHQCRQKTKDTKTFCRSLDCVGVRGQFCGVCLLNRYGEDAAEALKNPNWHCPPCRNICNCSFCRAREGKRPTGILTPLAFKAGHKSVKEFLDSLKGKGDYDNGDHKILLGFTKDLEYAEMGNGQKDYIGSSVNLVKVKGILKTFEQSLLKNRNYTEFSQDEKLLLGFTEDLHYAQMGNGQIEYLGSSVSQIRIIKELFERKLY